MSIEILHPESRADWLALRRKDVTASVAGALLGVHPYTTPYAIWAEKTGKISFNEDEDKAIFRRGRLLEPVVAAMLREDRPDWIVEYPLNNAYYRDSHACLGATPDAFATRPDIYGRGIVQFKTASDHAYRDNWLDPETGEVSLPLWIAVQAITEASLTGSKWASVALMVVGRGIELHVIDVPLHVGVQARLRAAVREFWRVVDAGEHPNVDWMRDGAVVLDVFRDSMPDRRDLTANDEIDELVVQYNAARNAVTAATKTADLIKPRIIAALGEAEIGETRSWSIAARTTRRPAGFIKPSSTRRLIIKPKENFDGRF